MRSDIKRIIYCTRGRSASRYGVTTPSYPVGRPTMRGLRCRFPATARARNTVDINFVDYPRRSCACVRFSPHSVSGGGGGRILNTRSPHTLQCIAAPRVIIRCKPSSGAAHTKLNANGVLTQCHTLRGLLPGEK